MALNTSEYLLYLKEYLDGTNYNYMSDIFSPIIRRNDEEYLSVKLLPFEKVSETHPISRVGHYYRYKYFDIVVSLEREDGTKIRGIRPFKEKNIPIVPTKGNQIVIELFVQRIGERKEEKEKEERGIKEGPILLKNFVSALDSLMSSTESRKIEGIKKESEAYLINLFREKPYYELCLYQYSSHGDEIVNNYLRGNLFNLISNPKEASDTVLNAIIDRWRASGKIFPLTSQMHRLGYASVGKPPMQITSINVGEWLGNPEIDEVTKLYRTQGRIPQEDEITAACELFVNDLKTIIQGAPKLPFDYVVFRGLTVDPPKVGELGFVHELGFLSTSIYSSVSKKFTEGTGSLMIINVPKDIPFLVIPQKYSYFRDEVEVLFPPNTQLTPLEHYDSAEYKHIKCFLYDMKAPNTTGGRRKRQTRKRKTRSRKYRK